MGIISFEETCSIKYCTKSSYVKRLCCMHYTRILRYGDPSVKHSHKGSNNPNYKHGYKGSRIYRIWQGMIARCKYPYMVNYRWYGGKGITVCDRWKGETGFQNFLEDMGSAYGDNLTIDRIDGHGNYEPGNVRWATRLEQAHNKTNDKGA